ncbi:hypothetical protein WL83_25265 [Burkholderia ubonensis]|nr:hypothetical protein WJ67_17155 [Burkholderia ubonensis]KWF07366.1 hypothetical protein WL83_25265 [Burkholderia ubonensis]
MAAVQTQRADRVRLHPMQDAASGGYSDNSDALGEQQWMKSKRWPLALTATRTLTRCVLQLPTQLGD